MKILILEDEIKLAQSIKKGLEQEGFVADFLTDGESGQRRLEMNREDYDTVILDIMLPLRDGITVCNNWRSKNINTPTIMLTAKDAVTDRIAGLNAGADDYLVKPFAFEELLARIRALLRRPRVTLPVELCINKLILNANTRIVKYNNKTIDLTLKEFMVLEYFMRNPNQVLTREQILDHAWDFAFDSFSNVVDVHVKNLRKKIDNLSNHEKLFETVRGLGYRIKA